MVSQGAKPLGRQKETQIVGFIHVVSSSECSDKSVFQFSLDANVLLLLLMILSSVYQQLGLNAVGQNACSHIIRSTS